MDNRIKIKAIVNRKDINENIRCIYCDERPHFYIQMAYVKGNQKEQMIAEDKFLKEYERQIINYNVIK